jgi:hypothetical protein
LVHPKLGVPPLSSLLAPSSNQKDNSNDSTELHPPFSEVFPVLKHVSCMLSCSLSTLFVHSHACARVCYAFDKNPFKKRLSAQKAAKEDIFYNNSGCIIKSGVISVAPLIGWESLLSSDQS